MIKFLHAADLHLDSPFAALRPEQAAARRKEQRQMLGALCDTCKRDSCQLLFLSGDLFDGQAVYRDTLDALFEALSGCGARVFISPGNHDYIHPASPYLTRAWPENVHIFTSPKISAVHLPELGCAVYGAAFTSPGMEPMLQRFQVDKARQIRFMVLHGDTTAADSPYNPISKADLAGCGMTYLALGHVHRRSNLNHTGETFYAWPGCPMGRGFDETGAKGVFIGEAELDSVRCHFVPLHARRYECLDVSVEGDCLQNIRAALPEDAAEQIFRITLTGESEGIDLNSLCRALDGLVYSLELRDETVPPLELWTSCGENTLEGMSLATIRQALTVCETPRQRRCLALAARRVAEVCERREMPVL